MISEIDVQDWDKVNPNTALENLDNLKYAVGTIAFHDDFHELYDDFHELKEFINKVELIRRKQVKQVAALLKPKEKP